MNRLASITGCALAALLLLVWAAAPALAGNAAQRPLTPNEKIAALNVEMDQAIQQVATIVNQPAKRYPRSLGVKTIKTGWVPPGGVEPDFATVDIRKTQQFPFADYDYVTSNRNGLDMFAGADIEFNPMTAFFYEDHITPKKRLTEAEMLEINALYRIIGKDREELGPLTGNPVESLASAAGGHSSVFSGMFGKLLMVLIGFGLVACAPFILAGKRKV